MEVSFQDLKLTRQFLNAIDDLGYDKPSPIQEKAIPLVLSGQDVIGVAQTGTGKTAAYLLPILMKLKYAQGQHPRAIIIAPTRELAMQIEEHVSYLAKYTDLRHMAAYGGVGKKGQFDKVTEGLDLLVATPGRLKDLYQMGLVLKKLEVMILDEADKMMDMGFMPQLVDILDIIPRKRQNLLFSATFSPKVEKLSAYFLEFPTKIEVAPSATTPEQIEQRLYEIPNIQTKINLVRYFLETDESFSKVIVFVKTRVSANKIYDQLPKNIKTITRVIHANKGQNTRVNAMKDFKTEEVRILIATDVVARGIDVTMVSHVINFDVPLIYEDYVHRIGRTGRAEAEGIGITFMNRAEAYHIDKIEALIRMPIPRLPIPEEVEIPKTPKEEHQAIEKEIDQQKRKDDPTFKGAFHKKQRKVRNKRRHNQHTKKKWRSKSNKGKSKTSKHSRHS